MTHDDAIALLSQRLDGPLPDADQAALDAWIAFSPDHAAVAEGFETQHGDLHTTFGPRRAAAQATAVAVARQLPPPATPSRARAGRNWFRPLALAACAAAIVVAVGGFFLFRKSDDGTPEQPPIAVATADPLAEIGLRPQAKTSAPATETLDLGRTLATESGDRKRVTLPDGSLLYVNADTRVALVAPRKLRLENGSVFLEAAPAKSDADKFVVETPQRSVTALGTKFLVSADAGGTGVLVTQGKVAVSGLGDDLLTTGRMLHPSGKVEEAPRASAALGWTRDLMASAESPLVPAGKHAGGSLVAVDPYGQEAKLGLVKFHVDVHIEDGFARTTIDQTYFNSENSRMEGTFYFPLPPDASLSRLAMYVDGDLMEGGMADRGHARDVYETIRHQNRDPALLEWIDGSVFKMRVFPLEPRQEKRILLSYTQRLPVMYGQANYRFPAGHTLNLVDQWSFRAVVRSGVGQVVTSATHPEMKLDHDGRSQVAHLEAKNAKVDRDVALTIFNPKDRDQPQAVAWSSASLDNRDYLMLRFRPQLESGERRERRDWLFLFESSAGRDPLVARAQVEVIRSMLAHAEHEDTFRILSVGTRVKTFHADALPATAENAAKAIAWLDQRHLIGALNLDQALSDAAPLLNGASNPHLVHVGGGIASIGEQRADELVKRIPEGVRYVGVGVGKRFSPAFMKVAAEKSGGLFTQVNPDEPIGWRGFEIASTLNAPRLLNVRVDCPEQEGVRFLGFGNAIAQGEEFAAVADVTGKMPTTVVVRGLLDGQPYEHAVAVSNVRPEAGYLPRSWAKLEIDRLLAEGSAENEKAITALSKAMYVMTPYTSLLVLENEKMYADFKVDRGRKDHWAMYPAPPRIPIVHIPDPNRPADARPDLRGEKPHENAVLQTILVRRPATVLRSAGADNNDHPVLTAGQVGFATAPTDDFAVEWVDDALDGARPERLLNETEELSLAFDFAYQRPVKLAKARVPALQAVKRGFRGRSGATREQFLSSSGGVSAGDALGRRRNLLRMAELPAEPDRFERFDAPMMNLPAKVRMFDDGEARWGLNNFFLERPVALGVKDAKELREDLFAKRYALMPSPAPINGRDKSRMFGTEFAGLHVQLHDPAPARHELAAVVMDRDGTTLMGEVRQAGSRPAYYSRPGFSGQTRVWIDLAAHAPGMSSSPADMAEVVAAEAAPRFGRRVGKVDPGARKLIDAARSAGFRTLELPKGVMFTVDGQGRYAYERKLPLGLVEKVVCDGTNLWHLYPELGIGAKRVVGRAHRAEVLALVPDLVLPADDLAQGCDVVFRGPDTVALVALPPERTDGQELASLEVRMVFEGGRLARREWVLSGHQEKPETLATASYTSATTTLQAGVQPPKVEARKLADAPTPDLKPDTRSLVILPMPLRTRETVYARHGIDPNLNLPSNRCYPTIDADTALELIAAEFAVNNGQNIGRLWSHVFEPVNDHRPGFFTLMASANGVPRSFERFNSLFEQNPSDPLLRYLWRMHDDTLYQWQARVGYAPGPSDADTFLGKLTTFRMIHARWTGVYADHKLWGQRDVERRRALEFAVRNAGNELGWSALAMVQDRTRKESAHGEVAAAWGEVALKSPLGYEARYEEARSLGHAGREKEAQAKFQALFKDALDEGVLPPLDAGFRSVLESGNQGQWAKLMRDTAAKCAEKKARPVVVTLAWQCYQVGDAALADALLDAALADIPAAEKPATVVAAVRFLNDTNRADRSDALLRGLLKDADLAKSSGLWRLAMETADARHDAVRAVACLERALDIEYDRLPAVYDVQPIRNDYGRLLDHYKWLADASATLKVAPPADLTARVIKAADRWRNRDTEANDVPNRVAAILRRVGGETAEELAWEYATTPLATKPNESDPWVSLASSARQEGNWKLADDAYAMAFAAEPTNAQLLWDRAQFLQQQGKTAESREILRKLVAGSWQPRFAGLKAQAELVVGANPAKQ